MKPGLCRASLILGARVTRSADDPDAVYFEHVRLGNSVKVSAVHAATGLEVSIVGPTSATQASLEALALRKLETALERANRK